MVVPLPAPLEPGPAPLDRVPFQAEPGLSPAWLDRTADRATQAGILLVFGWHTTTAYARDPVAEVVAVLKSRLSLDDVVWWRIETALSESVANALTHGNLGLSSHDRASGDFNAYVEAVEAALADPVKGQRPLMIAVRLIDDPRQAIRTLLIEIAEDGAGFIPDATLKTVAESDGAGRGITLIRELTDEARYSPDGRTLRLRFQL